MQFLWVPEHLSTFQCTVDQCDDTCCRDWRIPCEVETIRGLLEAAAGDADWISALKEGLAIPGVTAPLESFPSVRLDPTGKCTFLREPNYCALHARFGEHSLSSACATFPRTLRLRNGRLEGVGTLSCPELAKACLFSDGSAFVPLEASRFPRASSLTPASANDELWDELHRAIEQVISDDSLPLNVSLLLAAFLAHRLTEAARLRPQDLSEACRVECSMLLLPQQREPLVRTLEMAHPPINLLMPFLTSHLFAQLQFNDDRPLVLLIRAVLESLQMAQVDDLAPERFRLEITEEDLPSVYDRWASRRNSWTAAFSEMLPKAFRAYFLNAWRLEGPVAPERLEGHIATLLSRLLVYRFMVFGHPGLKEGPDAQDALERLKEVMVSVAARLARSLEHSIRMQTSERELLRGRSSLAHQVGFILF